MAWFNLFSGPTAEKLEQKGDNLSASGLWGPARLEYEGALRKLESAADRDHAGLQRLADKLAAVGDALAREHQDNATQLADIGDIEEALELVDLALELGGDAALRESLVEQKQALEAVRTVAPAVNRSDWHDGWREKAAAGAQPSLDEQFDTLCGTLPDAVRYAYRGYGYDFKTGYVALNNGEFETAARHLHLALEAQTATDTYIPLELATAYLHLNRPAQARELLEELLRHHPDALPAYQILCEVYWEQEAFDRAEALLASISPELATSRAVFVLQGETLFQAGRFEAAKSFYIDVLDAFGWDETIARALARTHEALDEMDAARQMYQEIMDHCSGCGNRVDPAVKEKLADLSFAAGIHDTTVLELYLSLAQELPMNAAAYYTKVSRIYHSQGNPVEAGRFTALAQQMARQRHDTP
jgi:predicted Zn-dependent protease